MEVGPALEQVQVMNPNFRIDNTNLAVSAYYAHPTHPTDLSMYKSFILSAERTGYFRFKHVLHTLLGKPYSDCVPVDRGIGGYTQHGCSEELLFKKLCDVCKCYPAYIESMAKIEADKNMTKSNCRKRFEWYEIKVYGSSQTKTPFIFHSMMCNDDVFQLRGR